MNIPRPFKAKIRITGATVILLGLLSCAPYYGSPHFYSPAYRNYPYHYHYYPGTRVYFNLYSGYYYYYSKDHWLRSRHLPPQVHLDPRNRVRVWIDTGKPYLHNREDFKKYGPGVHYQSDKRRDQDERRYNLRRHEEYLRKYGG